jgi:hypothetical protein
MVEVCCSAYLERTEDAVLPVLVALARSEAGGEGQQVPQALYAHVEETVVLPLPVLQALAHLAPTRWRICVHTQNSAQIRRQSGCPLRLEAPQAEEEGSGAYRGPDWRRFVPALLDVLL